MIKRIMVAAAMMVAIVSTVGTFVLPASADVAAHYRCWRYDNGEGFAYWICEPIKY